MADEKKEETPAFIAVSMRAISKTDVDDMIVTALEGGINYWAVSALPKNEDYREAEGNTDGYASGVLTCGGSLMIETEEAPFRGSNETKFELTLDKFKKGWEKHIEESSGDFDLENYDAGDADAIVQYALFGELVFG